LILSNILFIGPAGYHFDRSHLATFVVKQFDLAQEGNFATWVSSIMLFLNALCAYTGVRRYWSVDKGLATPRLFLSGGFLYLSLDDFIQLHEFLERAARGLLTRVGFEGKSMVYFVLLFGTALAITLTAYLWFFYLRSAKPRDLRLVFWSIGFILIGMFSEGMYRFLKCPNLSRCFRVEVVFEEGSELLAILLFLQFQRREMAANEEGRLWASQRETATSAGGCRG
jgi:hypothetical protein